MHMLKFAYATLCAPELIPSPLKSRLAGATSDYFETLESVTLKKTCARVSADMMSRDSECGVARR